jgi:hypothetical protein
VLSDQSALRATDGRQVQPEPQVSGEPETPGVSHALPVAEDHIRPMPQSLEGAEQGRYLAKGKQTGHIGEGDAVFHVGKLHELKSGKGVDGDRRNDGAGLLPVAHVSPGNQADGLGERLEDHEAGKAPLECHRLVRREVPGVKIRVGR